MRTTTSLNDIVFDPLHLFSVPGDPRLVVHHSAITVFHSQLSAAKHQICLLEAQKIVLKDSVKSISDKNADLTVENEALRAQARTFSDKIIELEKDKRKLVDELRVERLQATICLRRARQDRNKIMELESAAVQRDAFIHAMIDIDLHQHVLKGAYFDVRAGRSVDEVIVEAIQFAASKPASPWSRILAPPDITKSDIYKSAIELAATARIRTDQSIQVAGFWKHLAKRDPRNANIITPSSSTLESMDKDLKKGGQNNMLDGLFERLRAGEDIRSKENGRLPVIITSDMPFEVPIPPALAFANFYRAETGQATFHPHSHANRVSWESDLMTTFTTGNTEERFSTGDAEFFSAFPTPTSLERICGVFTIPSFMSSFDTSCSSSLDSFSYLHEPLQQMPLAPGRGRSATFPFSARELIIPSVKNVLSQMPVIMAPRDRERKAQSLTGQLVRFNSGISLVRAKAITSRRPRNAGKGETLPPARKVPFDVPALIATPTVNTRCGPPPVRNNAGLVTPPAEADSIRYVHPPTVTRRKGYYPPHSLALPLSAHFDVRSRASSDSTPCSPTQQKIKRYVVKNSSRANAAFITASPSSPPKPNFCVGPTRSTTESQRRVSGPQKQLKSPPKTKRVPGSAGENVSLKSQPSAPITPRGYNSGSSTLPAQSPLSVRRSCHSSIQATPSPPPRRLLVKPVVPVLKPVQPLRIVKRNSARKLAQTTFASPTPGQRTSVRNRNLSTLPR